LAVSRKRCCDILGWTKHYFDKAVREGMPVAERPSSRGGDHVVFMGDVIRWLVEREVEAAGLEPSDDLDLNAERARLAREQADGQAIKNAVARGELLPAEEVAAGRQAAVGHAAASALLRQGCPAHLRLGGEGQPGGEAGEQEPSLRERPVRAVQRRTGGDRDHDRLAGRAGEADQGEVDLPLLPAGADRARAQREQLDRGWHLPSRGTRTGTVRARLDRRRGDLSRREQPARS
jgi:phage terminase Nu1 subunit (DNA packaging protein)